MTMSLADQRRHLDRTVKILIDMEKRFARRDDTTRAIACDLANEALYTLLRELDRP